jgi:hypothetical protein
VSNAINRKIVTLVEDCAAGLARPQDTHAFFSYIDAYRTATTDINEKRTALLNALRVLVAAPKQRTVSDFKAAWFTPEVRQLPSFRDFYASIDLEPDAAIVAQHYPLLPDDDEIVLRPIVEGILTSLKRRTHLCFYWAHKLVEATERGVAAAVRKIAPLPRNNNPMLLLFELCGEFAANGHKLWNGDPTSLSAQQREKRLAFFEHCKNQYVHFGLKKNGSRGSHRDWVVFVIWPLLCAVFSGRIDTASDTDINTRSYTELSRDDTAKLYETHRSASKLLFDTYVYDQHTEHGRSLGRGAAFFVEHGAKTENNDDRFLVPLYRRMYVEYKMHIEEQESQNHSKKRKRTHDTQ